MRWDPASVLGAFEDELEKIGEISLAGLSPWTILGQKSPDPMATPGLERAQQILERARTAKTAGAFGHNPLHAYHMKHRSAAPMKAVPAVKTASSEDTKRDRQLKEFRDVGSRSLAGAGIGRLLAETSWRVNKGLSPRRKTIGTIIGAGAGIADHYLEKDYQRKRKNRLARERAMKKKMAEGLVTPPELKALETEQKIRELAWRHPDIDTKKLRSKMKAMTTGAAIGSSLVPVGVAASMLHRGPRSYLLNKWKQSPIETVVMFTPAIAGFSALGGKAGSSLAGKLHDMKHGSPLAKESAAFPTQQLLKAKSAFRFSTQKTFRPSSV